jgi:hypothetical protein
MMLSSGLQAALYDRSSTEHLSSINTTGVANTHVEAVERKWVALDQSREPDSEVRVALNRGVSNEHRTVFDITIPGFWMTAKTGDDGRVYQQIEIPGLGGHNELGQPDLPRYQFRLALPFSKGMLSMRSEACDIQRFQGTLVWPRSVPEQDGDR